MELITHFKALPLEKSYSKLLVAKLVFPMVLLILGIYHGLVQVLYRAGIIQSDHFLGLTYYQGLTLHGVINAVVFTTFFAVAFGHAVVLYYLRKGLNVAVVWIAFWLMFLGTLMAAYAMLSGQANVLYTFYPPLKAHPLFYIGATLLVVGSWVASFSWIPPYLRWRRDNPQFKTPLAVVGVFAAFIVWFIATIPLAVEVLGLLIPWSLGWTAEVNVTLARTLFWFFGHPLVYFWLLPVYAMYYSMFPKIAGGKLYSDFAGRLAFMLFILLSCPIGVHHQFSDPGIQSTWKWLHSMLTLGVSIPSFVTAFTLAASMEYGARKRGGLGLFGWWKKLPYFSTEGDQWMFSYFFVGLLLFIYGGITGIINSSASMNNVVHNTSWIPGHFHTTVGGPVFLGFIAMSLWMIHKLLGRKIYCVKAVVAVPYLWITGIAFFSGSMAITGLMGEPRRTNMGVTFLNPESPLYNAVWKSFSSLTVLGGVIMFLAMAIFFVCFFVTLFSKKVAAEELDFPNAEVLHNENVPFVLNFKPWIIAAFVLCAVTYTPPLLDIPKGTFNSAKPYSPENPVPVAPEGR